MAAVERSEMVGNGRERMMAVRDRTRAERLKAQLRANLRRRKEQARARARLAVQRTGREAREGDCDSSPATVAGAPCPAASRPEQGGDA